MDEVKFDRFYTYKEMEDYIFSAKKLYDRYLDIKSLAKTKGGREVYAAVITDHSTGCDRYKSAYYIQAGVHASEGAGTTAALYIMRRLLIDGNIKEILADTVFYILPRINPDGCEFAITKRYDLRSRFEETDNKNGLVPCDINNDGMILSMRKQDHFGAYVEDDEDSRLMVRRRPEDKDKVSYSVYTEGVLREFDGGHIKDGVRNIDFNRTFPANWAPILNSSIIPLGESEMRAAALFLSEHPNIFAGVDLHCGCNAILRPCMQPDSEMDQNNLEFILKTGKKAQSMTGFPLIHEREYKEPWRKPLMLNGNSNEMFYNVLGISHYVIELGNGYNCAGILTMEYLAADEDTRQREYMRRVLSHHDNNNSNIFVPWQKFLHPQLGWVEIGGLMGGCGYYMLPADMRCVISNVADFVLYHAALRPKLEIKVEEIKKIGPDIYRVRAVTANTGGMSTGGLENTGHPGLKSPVKVKLEPYKDDRILSRIKIFEFESLMPFEDPAKTEWFVRTADPRKFIVSAWHPKAGTAFAGCRYEQSI